MFYTPYVYTLYPVRTIYTFFFNPIISRPLSTDFVFSTSARIQPITQSYPRITDTLVAAATSVRPSPDDRKTTVGGLRRSVGSIIITVIIPTADVCGVSKIRCYRFTAGVCYQMRATGASTHRSRLSARPKTVCGDFNACRRPFFYNFSNDIFILKRVCVRQVSYGF